MPFVVMVAGPNGSGKTTLIRSLRDQDIDLGRYINADDIASQLIGTYDERVRAAQAIADVQRAESLANGVSFTFETVMSHESKVAFLQDCRAAGYETVVYFVGTKDARLNIARVAQRVALGGHDVPVDRIVSRYNRALELLPHALLVASRAAVFDNSDARGLRLGLSKAGKEPSGYHLAHDAPEWMKAGLEKVLKLQRA
jgi:predicted ABC-type ATPase